MDLEFRKRLTEAAIAEMGGVLDDPEADAVDHVEERSTSIDEDRDGTVEARMVFGGMPGWITESDETEVTGGQITGVLKMRTNPNTVIMKVRNSATATIAYRNPETGEEETQELTREQQETLDRYASRVAFHLTGVANGELLEDDPVGDRKGIDGRELVQALFTRVEEAELLADELVRRGILNKEDGEDGDIRSAVALRYALAGARINMDLLAGEIWVEVDGEDGERRWEPPSR